MQTDQLLNDSKINGFAWGCLRARVIRRGEEIASYSFLLPLQSLEDHAGAAERIRIRESLKDCDYIEFQDKQCWVWLGDHWEGYAIKYAYNYERIY